MTDDSSIRGPQDRQRINTGQEHELTYWSKKWGVSVEELRRLVGEVGPMAKDVAAKLGKRT